MNREFKLTKAAKDYLRTFKKTGGHSLREFNRATILLYLDKGLSISEIQDLLEVNRTTIWRIRKRYIDYGLELALNDKLRSGHPLIYTAPYEIKLSALASGPAPAGRRRWTIRLLVEELNRQPGFETITYGSVRMLLKKMKINLR